jgi:hypothetical protein
MRNLQKEIAELEKKNRVLERALIMARQRLIEGHAPLLPREVFVASEALAKNAPPGEPRHLKFGHPPENIDPLHDGDYERKFSDYPDRRRY